MAPEQSPADKELFLLEAWVADNPGSRLFIKLAEGYQARGQSERAAAVLERGLLVHPGEIEARRLYADVLRGLGKGGAALEQLELAAAELSRFACVFDGLASIYAERGQDQAAGQARLAARALAGEAALPARGEPPDSPGPPAAGAGDGRVLRRLEALRQAALSRAE